MPVLKNAKHEAVLQHYVRSTDRIGWKSYAVVYPNSSQHAAEVGWSRLLKKDKFKTRKDELENTVAERVIEKTAITKERIVAELGKLGFANMDDYVTIGADGLPFVDMSAVDRDKMAAVQEVIVETRMDSEINEAGEREAVPVRKVRFKLADKRMALVDIGKHLGMFKEQIEHSGMITHEVLPAAEMLAEILDEMKQLGVTPEMLELPRPMIDVSEGVANKPNGVNGKTKH